MNTYNKMLCKIGWGPHPKALVYSGGLFRLKLYDGFICLSVCNGTPHQFGGAILQANKAGRVFICPIDREMQMHQWVVDELNTVLSDNLQLHLSPSGDNILMQNGVPCERVLGTNPEYYERLC